MPSRDPKRRFTQTQKKQILFQQNNLCARCHDPLDPRAIEYHHKKPWAEGGRTISTNGMAVCPKCHAIITHEHSLNKQEMGLKKVNNANKSKNCTNNNSKSTSEGLKKQHNKRVPNPINKKDKEITIDEIMRFIF